MKKLVLLFALFFVFNSYSSQVWFWDTDAQIEASPVFFDNKIAIASQNGEIQVLDKLTGFPVTSINLGEGINQLEVYSNFIIASTDSRIFVLNKNLNITANISESTIYGITAADNIYATTSRGLIAITYSGKELWLLSQNAARLTKPAFYNGSIFFGSNDYLVVADSSGKQTTKIRVAQFWDSRPTVYQNTTYIGADDGKLYAIDTEKGKILWSFQTGGWIMSNPIHNSGKIYFGSNDGGIYCLNAFDGSLLWRTNASEAVQGNIRISELNSVEVVLASANDNKAYILNANNGEIIVTYSAGGWVRNPILNSSMLFFSSNDGFFYAYEVERSCMIEYPESGTTVAYSTITVQGRFFTIYSNPTVFVRIEGQSWNPALMSGTTWTYNIDPQTYDFGSILVQCRVGDSAGLESTYYSNIVLFRDKNVQKPKLIAAMPSAVLERVYFPVKAYEQNGSPISSFFVVLNDINYSTINGTVLMLIESAGEYNLTVEKNGYESETSSISVSANYNLWTSYAIGGLVIIGVFFYFFIYKRK
ncbi:PQQ-binding-like beta-propeller repeat protein [Candidatus Micrarchaeota archaeon]|nr:PQQ-binding-like beta-propeller repeat protein [Candidatus Micrarchaeota archaeon]